MTKRMSLAEMRASVASRQNSGGGGSTFWTPMDHLEFGQSATIRLVPWYDDISGGFWTEQKVLKATFSNPENDREQWFVHIPCLEQYSNDAKCPVANAVRDVFKMSDELKDTDPQEAKTIRKVGSDHWIKRSLMYQGFVLKGGNKEVDENVLVAIKATKQIHDVVSVVFDPDSGFERLPTGEFSPEDLAVLMDGGDVDMNLFLGQSIIMRKTKKTEGQRDYADYTTSTWSQGAPHNLNADQLEYIAKNGYIDLRKFLGEQPSPEKYEVYTEIMNSSIAAALEGDVAVWNPEWEAAGVTPYRPKKKDGEGAETGGGDMRSKLKARLNGGASKPASKEVEEEAPVKTAAASSLRDRLNKRGAAKDEEPVTVNEDDGDDQGNDAPEPEVKAAPAATGKPLSLAERIKAIKANGG